MAKKKTRVLWLMTTKEGDSYILCSEEPEWNEEDKWWWWEGELGEYCGDEFARFCPSLKLRKNTKCKLKLTNLKNGIKLEKVKAGKE